MSMEKNRRNQAFETAKTVVLAMLVASLAILLVIYIGGTHIYQSMTRTDEKRYSTSSGASRAVSARTDSTRAACFRA